jgi:MFS family permease
LIAALISLPKRVAGTTEEEEQRRSGIKEGFRYVARDRTMLAMVGLVALATIFVFPFVSVMLPLYVRNLLGLGADRMGLLMAVSGMGSLSGSIGLLSVAPSNRAKFIAAGVTAIACALFAMGKSTSFLVTAISMGILAIGLSMNFGLANTIVQERAPSHLRGRISAVFGLSFFGLMPIAGLLVTSVSDLIGMRNALMMSATVYGLGALIILTRAKCSEVPPESGADKPRVEAAPAPEPVATVR